ncbi:hypothetical protein [Promicromonospora sp. NPDC060271]|uniref:hypothetical protein n=1 Tax=Promicromonospora sp. NPDC060271 TaxID=3347089 RepID=UPI0036519505
MTGDPHADQNPHSPSDRSLRSPSDEERPAAQPEVEQACAEAEQPEPGSAPETFPGHTQAEAETVAERYGYGRLVQTITLAPSRLLGLVFVLVVVLALLGTVLLFRSDGGTTARVGGIAFYLAAAATAVLGLVPLPLRRPRPPVPRLFVFRCGVVFGVDGLLAPYAWPDLELRQTVVTSTGGSDQREVRRQVLWIGPRGRSKRFAVPSLHHKTVTDLARAGGATIS